MAAFATVEDLATYVQRDFSAEDSATIELVLDLVSAAIRSYTGQTVSVATTTDLLRANGGKIRLPQRPVTAVGTVTDNATIPAAVTYEWDGFGTVYVTSSTFVINAWDGYGCGGPYLVTYTHGYDTVPDDIRAITLQVAARAFGTLGDSAGVQSESVGSYSYSTGAAAAQGAVGMLAGERAVLDRYRLPAGPIVTERR